MKFINNNNVMESVPQMDQQRDRSGFARSEPGPKTKAASVAELLSSCLKNLKNYETASRAERVCIRQETKMLHTVLHLHGAPGSVDTAGNLLIRNTPRHASSQF